MKYTIQGFNQIEAIKLGLNNDDLIVLRWFIDFKNTSKMDKNYIKEVNDMGYWVNYSTLIEELPILLKDGNTYLEEYVQLQKIESKIETDDDKKAHKKIYNKLMEKNLKRVQRILAGNLSKVLKKDICKFGPDKGAKVYLYVDCVAYEKLISDTNIESYLRECGMDIVNKQEKSPDRSVQSSPDRSVQSSPDKSVQSSPDKSVQSDSSTTDSSTNDSSITSTTDMECEIPVVHTNKEIIEKNTHLKIDSIYKKNIIVKWEKDKLLKALEIFKNDDGKYFKFLKKIYEDDRNFVKKEAPQNSGANNPNLSIYKNDKNIPKVKTRFHNINESFSKHSPEELEKILLESQKGKFPCRDNNYEKNQNIKIG